MVTSIMDSEQIDQSIVMRNIERHANSLLDWYRCSCRVPGIVVPRARYLKLIVEDLHGDGGDVGQHACQAAERDFVKVLEAFQGAADILRVQRH